MKQVQDFYKLSDYEDYALSKVKRILGNPFEAQPVEKIEVAHSLIDFIERWVDTAKSTMIKDTSD